MNKRLFVVFLCGLALVAAVGAHPRFLEELCIGGGVGDAVDGGADFERDGDINTDGDVAIGGELAVTGNARVGGGDAAAPSVVVTAGDGSSASIHLNETDGNNGGSVWYDGGANKLLVGTRNNSATPVEAIAVDQGNTNVALAGDLAINGGDITTSQGALQFNPSGSGRFDMNGSLGKLRIFNDASGNASLDFYMWNSANVSTIFGEIFCIPADSTAGSEDGRFSLCLQGNGSVKYNLLVLDSNGNTTSEGDYLAKGGDITAGQDSSVRGLLTLWDGSGGNAPGCVKLYSSNGTAWHLFVEDDGTLKVHSALPSQNSDGSVVGAQS